ncbi:hypothetical protein [Shewanella mangrovisoli]|uniref:Uncharacterized protein n=1 Tax=Shewanella mangrovisoli TaxID=2864211 RepID=A0ABV4VH32_9GAMM
MSTQETAALIESVNNMTATVAGKMGQIDQKVETSKQDYESFKANADSRFRRSLANSGNMIKLDLRHLNPDKFYPVVFHNPVFFEVRLERYVHDDQQDGGILDYYFRIQNWSSGGDFDYAIQEHHKYTQRTFIGKVQANASPYSSAVWLRGGWSYRCYSSGRLHEAKALPVLIESETQNINDMSGTAYYLPILDAVDAGVVANGYIRGVNP